MKHAELPSQLEQVNDWLENGRKAAFAGREDKCWKEWWCIAQLYNRGAGEALFGHAACFERLEDAGETPDFKVTGKWGEAWVEVTEATAEDDRRAKTARRKLPEKIHLIGEDIKLGSKTIPGGRFRGGSYGDAFEEAQAGDIRGAIVRKASKNYANGAFLVIYPNSNADFAEPDEVLSLLKNDVPQSPFKSILVLGGGHSVIEIGAGSVRFVIEPGKS